jgi:YVTN family beta-propeller protein
MGVERAARNGAAPSRRVVPPGVVVAALVGLLVLSGAVTAVAGARSAAPAGLAGPEETAPPGSHATAGGAASPRSVPAASRPVSAGASQLAADRALSKAPAHPAGAIHPEGGGFATANVAVGSSPAFPTYDSGNGYVYVPNWGSDNVSVLSGTSVVATVDTGDLGFGAQAAQQGTYDPTNGYVYMPDTGSDNLSVIDGLSVVASLPTGASPYSAIYDPANGFVYVPNIDSGNVTVISGTAVVASVSVGSLPNFATVDPVSGEVYVTDAGSGEVSVLNGTAVVATIGVGTYPESEAYDPANGEVYVEDLYSNEVSVLNGSSLVATVAVDGSGWGLAFDAANGLIYAAGGCNCGALANTVSVIGGVSVLSTLSVGQDPEFATYDAGNECVYVTNAESGTVSLINSTTVTGTVNAGGWPYSATYDSANGYLYVPNLASDNVTVIEGGSCGSSTLQASLSAHPGTTRVGSSLVVTLAFSGGTLPYTWTLQLSGPGGPYPSNLPGIVSDNYTFLPTQVGIFYFYLNATDAVGDVSNVSLAVEVFPAWNYSVTLAETGLPPGTTWWANVTGEPTVEAATANLSVSLPNGSYAYVAGSENASWLALPGSFTVNGSNLTVPVTFRPVPYVVAFTEQGLPTGTGWSVTLRGMSQSTTNGSVDFPVSDGVYAYSVPALLYATGGWYSTSPGGNVTVLGANVTVVVTYSHLAAASLTFREDGSPKRGIWGVTLASPTCGLTVTTSGSSLSIIAPRTSLPYALVPPFGLSVASVVGPGVTNQSWLTVSGPATIKVIFGHVERLTFTERGLGPGEAWTVTVTSALQGGPPKENATTTSSSVELQVVEGPYKWTVRPSTDVYGAKPGQGTVGVGLSPKTVRVTFKELTSKATFTENGLPRHTAWAVEISGFGTVEGTGPSLVAELPNGTYNFTVTSANPGYEASSPSGTFVVVEPRPVSVLETFRAT